MLNRIIFLILLMSLSHAIFGASEEYFSKDARGWYWHEQDKDYEDDEEKEIVQNPIDQLNQIRMQIESAKAKAVLYPTEENIKNYIRIQNELTEHAQIFQRNWQEVVLNNPELNYSLKHPTNNIAKKVELDEKKKNEELAIHELASKSGLFFFYRSSCPYCIRFAPIVKDFAETYGIVVVPITTDGISLAEFPNSKQDEGQAKKFHVTVEPALFIVNPYTHQAIPVAYGLVSEADLKERILTIATRRMVV